MGTLLEKAQSIPIRGGCKLNNDLSEMEDLAIAYAEKRITTFQVAEASGLKRGSVHNVMGGVLLRAARTGRVVIVKKEGGNGE